MNFVWNTKKLRTRFMDPEQGRQIIVERTPAEIVKSPNRYEFESVVQALTAVAAELVEIQENNAKNFEAIKSKMDANSVDAAPIDTRQLELPL